MVCGYYKVVLGIYCSLDIERDIDHLPLQLIMASTVSSVLFVVRHFSFSFLPVAHNVICFLQSVYFLMLNGLQFGYIIIFFQSAQVFLVLASYRAKCLSIFFD
jgi:hypothetical protein